jgi:hypothetical protein
MKAAGCCDDLAGDFDGQAMTDLPLLASRVEKTGFDPKAWVTTFRCKTCGRLWEEKFRSEGHANVPTVVRVPR